MHAPDDAARTVGAQLLERGELALAREWFESALLDPTLVEDPALYAEVAIGLSGLWIHEQRTRLGYARIARIQREALRQVSPDSASAWRLRLRLCAAQCYLVGDPQAMLALLVQARSHRSPLVLADALACALPCLTSSRHLPDAVRFADELIEVAASTDRAIDGLVGLLWRTVTLLRWGDRRAQRSLNELREGVIASSCPAVDYLVGAIDVMQLIGMGSLEAAELAASACRERGRLVGDLDADGFYFSQLIAIRWLQRRTPEIVPMVRELVDSTSVAEPAAGFRPVLAGFGADAGLAGLARGALAELRSGSGLRGVVASTTWLATMASTARGAHALQDADAAREVLDLLAPHADLPVIVSIGVSCFGSARYAMGLCADTAGDLDSAIDHLQQAADHELGLGWPAWRIRTLDELGRVLRRRGSDDDQARAHEVDAEQAALAERLEMSAWHMPAGGPVPTALAMREVAQH